jgi:hypothetical protein
MGKNTLAYFAKASMTVEKKFKALTQDCIVIKPFFSLLLLRRNKLECLSLTRNTRFSIIL